MSSVTIIFDFLIHHKMFKLPGDLRGDIKIATAFSRNCPCYHVDSSGIWTHVLLLWLTALNPLDMLLSPKYIPHDKLVNKRLSFDNYIACDSK